MHGPTGQPVVIGIDTSATHTAIAAYRLTDGAAMCWVHNTRAKGAARLLDINHWVAARVSTIILRGDVKEICMEGYGFASQWAHTLGEAGAMTKLALISKFGSLNKLSYPTVVAPPTLKKFVTGKGDSKKQEMLLSIYKKWDVDINDDNAADAYALARVAAALVDPATTLHQYERDIVAKLVRNTEWSQQQEIQPTESSE